MSNLQHQRYLRMPQQFAPDLGRQAFAFDKRVVGQRGTLAVGAYDVKGREGYLTLAAAREIAAGWSKQYKDGARDLRQHFAKLEAERLQAGEDARRQADKDKRAAATAEQQAELDRQRRLTVKQMFERWAATELAPHIGGDGKRIGRKDGGQYVREQFERRVFASLGDIAVMDVRKQLPIT